VAAQAPNSIAGATISAVLTDRTGPLVPPGTLSLLLVGDAGNTYRVTHVWPMNWQDWPYQPASYSGNSGTCSYSASGNTGTLDCNDALMGHAVTTLTYSDGAFRSYHLNAGPYAADYDSVELFSGAAPASPASSAYYVQVEYGLAPFAATGSLLLKLASDASSYTIIGDGLNTFDSFGTYSHARINRATRQLNLLNDSLTGNSTAYFSYSNAIAGQIVLKQPSSGGMLVGRFINPALVITLEGQEVLLSWPALFGGFVVESSTNLAGAVWDANCPAPVIGAGVCRVTLPIPDRHTFYRLSSP